MATLSTTNTGQVLANGSVASGGWWYNNNYTYTIPANSKYANIGWYNTAGNDSFNISTGWSWWWNYTGQNHGPHTIYKQYTYETTGLKPNTYYNVVTTRKIKNNCAIQPGKKTITRYNEFESTGVNLKESGKVTGTAPNIVYNSLADQPMRTDSQGHLKMIFDAAVWSKDAGSAFEGGWWLNWLTINGYKTTAAQDAWYTSKGATKDPETGVWSFPVSADKGYGWYYNYPYYHGWWGYYGWFWKGARIAVRLVEAGPVDAAPAANTTIGGSSQPSTPTGGGSTSGNGAPTVNSTSRDLGVISTERRFGTNGEVGLSEVTLYFDYAQTFYLDPALLDNSQYVSLTDVRLFFQQKPHRTNNQSGLENPGVFVFLTEVADGVPDLRLAYRDSIVRVSYDEVSSSLDATEDTVFAFSSPIALKTGKQYAIVINFEDPQYSLWTATQGKKLIGSEETCDGAYNFGKLFRASNYGEIDNDPKTQDEVLKPLPATDLKFTISALQFTDDQGNLQTNKIELVNEDYEFIIVKDPTSAVGNGNLVITFGGNQLCYQDFGNAEANVTFYGRGKVSLDSAPVYIYGEQEYQEPPRINVPFGDLTTKIEVGQYLRGTGTNFVTDFQTADKIILTDGIVSNGVYGNIAIREVRRIVSDTVLIIDEPCTFSMSNGFYKSTAVAKMDNILFNPDTLVMKESNAREDIMFIANGVNYITFTGGTGYSNTDYISFTGNGAFYPGTANIVTDASGTIQSINITNSGAYFVANPSATVYKSGGGLSTGSGATFRVQLGSQLRTQQYGGKAEILDVSYFPVSYFVPSLQFNIKGGKIKDYEMVFAVETDATSLQATQDTANTPDITYTLLDENYLPVVTEEATEIEKYNAVVLSKSLEMLNSASLVRSSSEGKSAIIRFSMTADNRYDSPELHRQVAAAYVFQNEINNDATGEHLGSGNAVARHISKKISFAKDRFAEDIRVISIMYKPPGTDVKIYAKCHNSKDEEAFDDKDWTELEVKDATFSGRTVSSLTNRKDFIELTYGFPQYPPMNAVLTGTAKVGSEDGNSMVVGVGTDFLEDLAPNDMVVLFDPNQTNTTYGVAVVNNVVNSTVFYLDQSFSNLSLSAATLTVGKVYLKNQVYNNILADNVATYYSTTTLTPYETYDTFAIKVVMLANSYYNVPRLADIRAIGVSA